MLVPHAEAVRDRLATARAELAALRSLDGGLLRLGSFSSATAALVPRAQAVFRERHPGWRSAGWRVLREAPGPGGHGRGGPRRGLPAPDAPPPPGVTLHHLLDEPMLVALPRGHAHTGRRGAARGARGRGVDRRHRAPGGHAVPPGRRGRVPPARGLLAGEWIAKLGAVAAGLGVTLVPALAAASVRPDVALVTIHPEDVPYRPVHAATPPVPTVAATAFLAVLRETAQELTDPTPY
ncbi:LysR substrate-binding domain-containing protein [Streptomyces diastatochromogenes]|nr:LysR substrate-binding domain-containing protein [Streptomyces diastatochromogenes]